MKQNFARRANSRTFVLVQGLFEKSDSIGFDAYYQYKVLKSSDSHNEIHLVAERIDPDRYKDVQIQTIEWFYNLKLTENDLVIYHYCDGWSDLEEHLSSTKARLICRWHNNTPPWFYAANDVRSTKRTVQGFNRIREFIQSGRYTFAVNSHFTGRQLQALGYQSNPTVVFPATRYLDVKLEVRKAPSTSEQEPLHLLFVSRVVAHKGHKHVLCIADFIQRAHSRKVEVHFAGRQNPSASDYDEYLDTLSQDLNVTMVRHGELSEEELRDLYNKSDVFCCLSEHEGFGLPMFEAYACGLPAISWGICAVGELTHLNPLSLEEFSIPRFAAAALAASDPANRATVLDMQKRLLGTYSKEGVDQQILSLVQGQTDSDNDARDRPLDDLDLRDLLLSVDFYEAQAEAVIPRVEDHETSGNLVTPYDLASYESLIFGAQGGEVLALVTPQASASIELKPSQFFTNFGVKSVDSIIMAHRRDGYDVFGPYISLPPGHYRVEFLISLKLVAAGGMVRLVADVASEMRGTITESVFQISAADPITPTLSFLVTERADVFEFRLKAITANSGPAAFTGVVIKRLADPTDLAKPARRKPSRSASTQFIEKLQRLVVNRSSPAKINKHFHDGDRLRDKKQWREAAESYVMGLKLSPEAFDFHIQAGHCFKEAGDFEQSAHHYEEALRLNGDDPDLLLNMGHLYKIQGEHNRAQQCYAYAVATYPAVLSAMTELSELGISVSQASELAVSLHNKA